MKQNVVRKYQSQKTEIYLTFFSNFCLFHFSLEKTGTWHPRGRVCSTLHMAINSSLSSILFDFADILILRNIKLKVFQSLVFLLCNVPTFDTCFFKKRVQISNVSVITIAIRGNNSKKLDERWTRPTFL